MIPGCLPLLRTQISRFNLYCTGALLQLLLHFSNPYLTIHYGGGCGIMSFLRAY
jgi:hypothetical protein